MTKKGKAKLRKNELSMSISFSYSPQMVARVKRLQGRRYISKKKLWIVPLSIDNVEDVQTFVKEVDEHILTWYADKKKGRKKRKRIRVPDLKQDLRRFQEVGVGFLESRKGRALLADEMGLGKTVQTLAWLQLHPELRPALVVCPASVKENWAEEIANWMDSAITWILHGRKPSGIPPFAKNAIVITNYDIVPNQRKQKGKKKVIVKGTGWEDLLVKLKPKVLVMDECHFIKNNKADRTRALKRIGRKAQHVIGLSGTPIVNRPVEMYNTIQLIDKTLFPSFWEFTQHFCAAKHNGFAWDYSGASHTDELHNILTSTIMLRRLKKDVIKELPPKVRTVIPVVLNNQHEYSLAEEDFAAWLTQYGTGESEEDNALVRVEKLKQVCIEGKMKACFQWIDDFLLSDQKLLVVATHTKVIQSLMTRYKKIAVRMDGKTKKRQESIIAFNEDPDKRLMVGQIKVLIGMNLQASCSNVVTIELGWTPGDHDQAEDRVHRIGQKSDSVNAWYLIARGTIEDEIMKLLDEKRKVLTKVLDGKKATRSSLLTALLKRYRDDN